MKLKISLILISMVMLISLVGCTAGDLNQPMYVPALYPNGNNTGNVGSSSAYWQNGYFTNINGAPYSPGGVPSLTNGHLFVGSALNVATDKAVSGDATLINTGALTVTGIQGHGITLPVSTGFLKYDPAAGGAWSFGAGGGISSVDTGTPSNITGIVTGNGSVLGHITDNSATWNSAQAGSSILTALSGLSYSSGSPVVRMNGAASFTLDTNTYLTAAINNATDTFVASVTITAGQVCYETSAGQMALAQANSSSTMPATYIATATVTIGNSGVFTKLGDVTIGAWTPGQLLYVSDSVAGGITATLPSAANDVIEVIGWAVSATVINFQANLNTVVHN